MKIYLKQNWIEKMNETFFIFTWNIDILASNFQMIQLIWCLQRQKPNGHTNVYWNRRCFTYMTWSRLIGSFINRSTQPQHKYIHSQIRIKRCENAEKSKNKQVYQLAKYIRFHLSILICLFSNLFVPH